MKTKPIIIFTSLIMLFAVLTCKKNPTIPNAEVLTRPVIWVNMFEMTFAASAVGGNPAAQILKVKNSGKQSLSYSISSDQDWISVLEDTGTSNGDTNEHSVLINKNGLEPRDEPYLANISITCTEAYNNPQQINVSLMISEEPPPKIYVSPKKLSFGAQVDGPNPASQNIYVQNTGGSTLNFEVESDSQWLSVDPPGGTSNTKEKRVKVSVNTLGMKQGEYEGTISIKDPAADNSPQIVSVTLTVSKEPLPEIGIRPKNLTFNALVGSNPHSSQNIYVSNNGGGTLSYNIEWDANWLSVNPTGGNVSGNEKRHSVSVISAGLASGNYSGTILISDPNATNNPRSVNVTLHISQPLDDNEIGISLNPTSGGTGTTVTIPIDIKGNTSEISSFGLNMNFDPTMFDYQSVTVANGSLTGNWTVGGNADSLGNITIGGYAGMGSIPIGSQGSIAIVTIRVTCNSCSDGQISQITISNLVDIEDMTINPGSQTFTYRQ